MQLLNDDGEFELAPYDAELLAVVVGDFQIRNPFISECGRFAVDPIEAYGFVVVTTGGGCMALSKALPDGGWICLTDDDGCHLPDTGKWEDNIIGRFDSDNQQVAWIRAGDVPFDGDE